MTATDAVYVYGVVPSGTSPDVFANVAGIAPPSEVAMVDTDGAAAIVSRVPLADFGTDALEANLKKPDWLEQKVHAHNAVLAAALEATTVLPFRFGTIYNDEQHVRAMLAERAELADTLTRLRGTVEYGVKVLLDSDVLRARRSQAQPSDPSGGSGTEYLRRKQLEKQLDEEARTFASSCAEESHARLAAASQEARANPAQHPAVAGGQMLLNGAYLVAAGQEQAFRTALEDLRNRFGDDGVTYELTGPWPPYNFVDEEATQ
jgi:hypothetical protein